MPNYAKLCRGIMDAASPLVASPVRSRLIFTAKSGVHREGCLSDFLINYQKT